MRKNDLAEIKKMDIKVLAVKLAQIQMELNSLVIDQSMNKLADKKAVFKKRIDLAQALTILRQKQLLAELEKGVKNAR